MRFTTWSTVTKVVIITTVALLSLLPAANAQANGIKIGWMHPLPGETYQAGKEAQVEWLVLGDENTYSQSYSTTGYLYLKSDISGQSYTLQENLPIFNTTTSVTYPTAPGNDYQIIFETEYGLFYSGNFTLI